MGILKQAELRPVRNSQINSGLNLTSQPFTAHMCCEEKETKRPDATYKSTLTHQQQVKITFKFGNDDTKIKVKRLRENESRDHARVMFKLKHSFLRGFKLINDDAPQIIRQRV